jgi:azurin
MKTHMLLLLTTLFATPAVLAQAPAKFEITCNDQMTYNTKGFEVTAGQKVSLTLKNVGKIPLKTMGHNLVLLKPGTSLAEFAGKAGVEKNKGYMPQDAETKKAIIAATKRLGGGDSDTITFALTGPGEYPFMCTTPGHFSVMQGVITVKAK